MSDEHVLDGAEDFLLAVARQGADAVENGLGLADGAGAALGRGLFAQELVGGRFQYLSQLGEIVGAQGDSASLPTGVSLLGDAKFIGYLSL